MNKKWYWSIHVVGYSNDESNFYDELLLTNTQVSNLCSWFIRLSNAFAFPGPELPTINYQLSTSTMYRQEFLANLDYFLSCFLL